MCRHHASEDPALSAVITGRVPLTYEEGADPATDRPVHVRAASGLALVGDCVAVVQDDASFIALVDPLTGRARAIPLPADDGVRQFDRGNKKHKLDTESCVTVSVGGDLLLLAFGSGSKRRRERVASIRFPADSAPEAQVVELPALYGMLRRATAFAGSDMNIEGAVVIGDRLRLLNRGNGRARDAMVPVNATCDVDLGQLLAHLGAPDRELPPKPTDVVAYELGRIGDVALGFTDAAHARGSMLYSAAAEASPDTIDDGPVHGSAIGVIGATGEARWARVVDEQGRPFDGKVEGILLHPGAAGHLLAAVDADDPGVPSELCTIELRGTW